MRRWTITAAGAIVVLLACGQPDTVEDRLIEAEKRLAAAEERIAAYERESATPTPTAAVATPTPTSTAHAGWSAPVDVYLRAIDLWPELEYDGVLDEECKHEIQKAGKLVYLTSESGPDLHKRLLSTFRQNEYYRLHNVITALKDPGENNTVIECLVFKEQMEAFWQLKTETASRWERGFPYPNSGP